jgi:hypothetical protein
MAYGVNAPFGLRPYSSISGGSWTEKTNEYFITPAYPISIFSGDLVVLSASLASINTIALYLPTYTAQAAGTINTFTQTTPVLGVFVSCQYFDVTNKLVQSPFWPAATAVYPNTTVKAFVIDDPDVVWDVQISTPINALAGGAGFAGGVVPGLSAAPLFPSVGASAATSAGIGSTYSIMGGGGVNFNTVANPNGGVYANNPTSTMTDQALGTGITVFGTNPYGGNTRSGQSGAYLCVNTAGANTTTFNGVGGFNTINNYDRRPATLPLKVLGFTPDPNNTAAVGATLQTTPFLNVLVTINNHVWRAGTVGQTFT